MHRTLAAAVLLLPLVASGAPLDAVSPPTPAEPWSCEVAPGPGPASLPDWAFALPEGPLQVEVVGRTPASPRRPGARWATVEKDHPAVLRVTADTVSLQRLADALSSATGLRIFVAPELQHLRVTQHHPAGRLSEILDQLRTAPVRIDIEEGRVALRAAFEPEAAGLPARSVVVSAEQGLPTHLRDLWCAVVGSAGDTAGVVDGSVVVTGRPSSIEQTRDLWTRVLAAGGGRGEAWSCRWTPGSRPIPPASPRSPGTMSLEVVGARGAGVGLYDPPPALLDVTAKDVAFGEFALTLAKSLGVPTSIDPRLHTTRVSLRVTAASMEDLADALAHRWSVHPGDDGNGNTLWDVWRPSHALGSWHLPTQERRIAVIPVGDALTARQLAASSCALLSDHGALLSTGEALVVRDLGPPLEAIRDVVRRTTSIE